MFYDEIFKMESGKFCKIIMKYTRDALTSIDFIVITSRLVGSILIVKKERDKCRNLITRMPRLVADRVSK